jgi:superfamily II DNA or RNA helicase/HKD family nuclease
VEYGLYELLLTAALNRQIQPLAADVVELGKVDPADQPHVLARHVAQVVESTLSGIGDQSRRLEVVTAVLDVLAASGDTPIPPVRQLFALSEPSGPGIPGQQMTRPTTPLSDAALLTNAHGEPNLGSQIQAEVSSADEVDLLCAFVKWHGLRLLESDLIAARLRGAPLRVITTTYMGATERRALDRLVAEFGAEVKIQYDALRTRLHAKAWMFRRRTGFDTAYVGSSNLSRAAMLDGVEWNVRLSQIATPSLLQKFRATFDTYWNDASFETYDPERDHDRLDDALAHAGNRTGDRDRVTLDISGLEVTPFPYQAEMLDALHAERIVHDRHRNLIVAATGTGKTVIAALDYRRLASQMIDRPSLLFVAHRQEILTQSLRTYREVLSDGDFGELYVGGARPERWRHVFASVQSLTSYGVESIQSDAFDVVVIDEFHHAEARTYRRLIDHLRPEELLGLTATPERSDGTDVRSFFDGRIAAELRLWEALGADLLCPFHYFGVADGTDLRSIRWTRGRYDEHDLGGLYTGNHARARIVLKQVEDKINNPQRMRALGFCVSVAHAEFMARVFTEAGIPARAVSGGTSKLARDAAFRDIRQRHVNALFAADLFNEGLDIPDVDTLFMLRPTESATLFLQQLGRGLRRTPEKAVLTVLDFVGHHRTEFRFDQKLQALTGRTRGELLRDVQRGFPFLPSGTQIVLDRQTQNTVLENIRSQIITRRADLIRELRRMGDVDLRTFVANCGAALSSVLKIGWMELRREADLPTRPVSKLEKQLRGRTHALAHVDDRPRRNAYDRLLADDAPGLATMSAAEQHAARMLYFTLWPSGDEKHSYESGWASLHAAPALRDELRQVIDLSFSQTSTVAVDLEGALAALPLRIHARYRRDEILAGLGWATLDRLPTSMMQGVVYVHERNIDAFFVTLTKSEADYSPSTMYRDYPISRTLFHWESQSTTSADSPTGRRYLDGSSTVLIFVRQQQKDELGAAPYLFAGPATYVSHEGSRPIAVTWRLEHPLPTEFYTSAAAAAG